MVQMFYIIKNQAAKYETLLQEFKEQDKILKIQEDEIKYYEKLHVRKDWDTQNAIHYIKRRISLNMEPVIEHLNLNHLEIQENIREE